MQKINHCFTLLVILAILASCGERDTEVGDSDLPTTNQETFEKFLPPDVQVLHLRPHPNGHERIGILFVTNTPLDSVRRFYVDHFEQCRIDIDVDPNLCISVFEDTKLPAVITAGHDEPSNKQFVRVFVPEEDWSEAVQTGASVIGILAVEPHLLPDGINKQRDSTS